MSGIEVFGVVASCISLAEVAFKIADRVKEHVEKTSVPSPTDNPCELAARLRALGRVLRLFGFAARRVQSLTSPLDEIRTEALLIIEENLTDSKRTLANSISPWLATGNSNIDTVLSNAAEDWCNNTRGRSAREELLKALDDRVRSMELALRFIETDYLYDIHHTVRRDGLPSTTSIDEPPRDDSAGSKDAGDSGDRRFWELFSDHQGSVSDALSPTLILFIRNKDYKGVQIQLESQEPLAEDSDGWCALHYAVRADSKRVMRALLDSDSVRSNGVDKRDRNGATPLHFAASIGKRAMLKILLQAGADKDAVDNHGRSPLFMAFDGNHEHIVELLLDSKAKVELLVDSTARAPHVLKRFKEMQSAISFRRRLEA